MLLNKHLPVRQGPKLDCGLTLYVSSNPEYHPERDLMLHFDTSKGDYKIAVRLKNGKQVGVFTIPTLMPLSGKDWFVCVVQDGKQVFLELQVSPKAFWDAIHFRDPSSDVHGYREFLLEAYAREVERQKRIAAVNGDIRRVRELSADGNHSPQQWRDLLAACGNRCARCGRCGPLSKDHIRPISKGGSNGIENIQALCRSCDSWKGTRTIDFRDHLSQKPKVTSRNNDLPGSGA